MMRGQYRLPVLSEISLVMTEFWVSCCLHPLLKNSVQKFARDWQEHDSSVVFAVSVPFLWQLDDEAFPIVRKFLFLSYLLKEAERDLSGYVQVRFQRFHWYVVCALCFPMFQLLSTLPDLLFGGLFNVDLQRCFCRRYVWGIFRCCPVYQFREVLCPSAELFLDCGQRLPLFVLDWLFRLLVSSFPLPCDEHALQVSLCCSFFGLSCQTVNVASLFCSYSSLHVCVSYIVFFLGFCFCCPGSAVTQGYLHVFSNSDLL